MERGTQLALVFMGLTLASVALGRFVPRGLTWSVFAAAISLAAASLALHLRAYTAGMLELTAWVCASLSVLWGFAANLAADSVRPTRGSDATFRTHPDQQSHRAIFAAVAGIATLATGLGAGIIVLTILAMRVIYFTVALVGGSGGAAHADYGFHLGGLGIIGLLFASSALAATRTRLGEDVTSGEGATGGAGATGGLSASVAPHCTGRQAARGTRGIRHGVFATVFYWLAVASVAWSCLLAAGDLRPDGERFHTTVTLKLAAALGAVLMGAVVGDGWRNRRRDIVFPGLRTSCGVVGLGVMLLCCYHLVVPAGVGGYEYRLTAAAVALISLTCGTNIFFLVGRRWSVNLAELAMALVSVGICALAVMTVPSRPMLLADRFPMIFNAMVVGLALGAWVWSCLATRWRRLAPYAERFSFTTACLGLLTAAIMAIWPRLPRIAAMDDSLGRFAAGIGGNLLLLLVTLWCARRLKRVTFHLLALLVIISTVGFLAVRIAPFTPAG